MGLAECGVMMQEIAALGCRREWRLGGPLLPEPTAGVDTSRITTKAEKVAGGWVVNGQKVWITNAQNAHKILLLARTSARNEENHWGRSCSSRGHCQGRPWTRDRSPRCGRLRRTGAGPVGRLDRGQVG